MKLHGKQVSLASGHGVDDEVIILQYRGSFPGGTTGELKQWHALRKAGAATELEPGPGAAPIMVRVLSVGAERSGPRPNDPAHTVYLEVQRVEASAAAPGAEGAPAQDATPGHEAPGPS